MPRKKRIATATAPAQTVTVTPGVTVVTKAETAQGTDAQAKIDGIVNDFKDGEEQNTGGRPSRSYKREAEELRAQLAAQENQAIMQGFKTLSGAFLDVLCIRLPNPVPATEQEKEIFGEAAGALASKYADSFGKWKEEIAFALATVMILAPRMVTEKKKSSTENTPNATKGDTSSGENGEREKHVSQETA